MRLRKASLYVPSGLFWGLLGPPPPSPPPRFCALRAWYTVSAHLLHFLSLLPRSSGCGVAQASGPEQSKETAQEGEGGLDPSPWPPPWRSKPCGSWNRSKGTAPLVLRVLPSPRLLGPG